MMMASVEIFSCVWSVKVIGEGRNWGVLLSKGEYFVAWMWVSWTFCLHVVSKGSIVFSWTGFEYSLWHSCWITPSAFLFSFFKLDWTVLCTDMILSMVHMFRDVFVHYTPVYIMIVKWYLNWTTCSSSCFDRFQVSRQFSQEQSVWA